MTQIELLDTVRHELNRRYEENREKARYDDYYRGMNDGLDSFESFLDTLQKSEKKDVGACMKEYYGEDLSFEDERTKAAYHFFSAGCSFELRQIEEEQKQHIVDLLDNYKKGRDAGYKKAIEALKAEKIEVSPVMKEFLTKLLGSGFGFGPSQSENK